MVQFIPVARAAVQALVSILEVITLLHMCYLMLLVWETGAQTLVYVVIETIREEVVKDMAFHIRLGFARSAHAAYRYRHNPIILCVTGNHRKQ